MLAAATAALNQIASPAFRAILWKTLALTLALLLLAWGALEYLAVHYLSASFIAQWPWAATILQFVTGVGLLIGMAYVVAPVSSIVAGLFLDELAEKAEAAIYPLGVRGRAMPAGQAFWLGLRFAAVSLAVNFCALLLLLAPGINAFVFLVANAYLLGREYFEFAALRFHPIEEVRVLRARHALTLFICGLALALFVATPIVNLATPLFGAAFMVRVNKLLAPPQQSGNFPLSIHESKERQ